MHFPERSLATDKLSRAILARNPNGKAVVFIHGFGGNALSTWSKFDSLLPDEIQGEGHDLLFYGYDGLRSDMVSSATLFLQFLDELFSRGEEIVNSVLPPAAQRPSGFAFSEILIAAHSLGAPVARWALLMAHDQQRKWVSRTQMVLFAPAHRGANVVKIALLSVTGFRAMHVLAGFARFHSPLIDQLAPDSLYLKELQARVSAAVGNATSHYLLAKAVLIAQREHVVINLPFPGDPYPIAVPDSDHFSVCKPQSPTDSPLRRICDLL